MAESTFDAIIVGQGLAGTVLAWHLREAGQRVLLLDRDEPVTSSKIAAGLITPITGQRLTLSWRIDEFLPAARSFYRRIEKSTGKKFYYDRMAVRLFNSPKEHDIWQGRDKTHYLDHLLAPPPTVLFDPKLGSNDFGGFAMHAAQLDVAAFIETSRRFIKSQKYELDWQRDVEFLSDRVRVQDKLARHLISCEGFAAAQNPYFGQVPFNAAKGNILTVQFQEPVPTQCFHRGIWIAPTSKPDIFRVGSSYDWKTLDHVPDDTSRELIESKLKEFFKVPYNVVNHEAAVRPILRESKPLIGLHPDHQQLGYFNGLGSKGSLLAPWFAQCLASHLIRQTPIDDDINVQKTFTAQ